MTQQPPSSSTPVPPRAWKLVLLLAIRVMVSWSLLFTAYYLIPTKDPGGESDLPWLALVLGAFCAVVALMIPAIIKSKHPAFRAVEALTLIIPLYLLIFARIYLSNSLGDTSAFTESLDRSSALYFTVTVFATVGFGDIVARTDGMRLLVTAQMLGNLVVLGAVVRLVVVAARRGIARRDSDTDHPSPDQPSAHPPRPDS